jgi:putative transposase
MPEHVHLIVYPLPESDRIHRLLTAIKRPFSYRIKQLLLETNRPLLGSLTIRQRPGVSVFRFWQEGPGYDRNLETVRAVEAAIDYLHMNPVRRGLTALPVDWTWSSAKWYAEAGPEGAGVPRLYRFPGEWLDAG